MKTLIKNGNLFLGGHLAQMDLLIQDQKIQSIGYDLCSEEACDQVIEAEGLLVTPGLIDVHVHYREPGQTDKETVKTGSRAAARGGYTTVCTMANTTPVPNTVPLLEAMIKRNKEEGCIKIHQYAPITEDLKSDRLIDGQAMKAAGAFALSNDGFGVQSAGTMYEAMLEAKKADLPICVHLEDRSLFKEGVINEGKIAEELGLPGIHRLAEVAQLARDLEMVRETGVRYHVCHVSTKTSLDLIRKAKVEGLAVTCEAAPHHLLLNEEDITEDDAYYKMNPPLRSVEDQEALIQGLMDGTVDMIATDHAPHTKEEKSQGFRKSPFGIIGIETAFALLYTHLVKEGRLTLTHLLSLMTTAPSQTFDLGEVGRLEPGKAADITLFDLETSQKILPEEYLSKAQNSPFNRESVYGMAVMTIVDGQVVYNKLSK